MRKEEKLSELPNRGGQPYLSYSEGSHLCLHPPHSLAWRPGTMVTEAPSALSLLLPRLVSQTHLRLTTTDTVVIHLACRWCHPYRWFSSLSHRRPHLEKFPRGAGEFPTGGICPQLCSPRRVFFTFSDENSSACGACRLA